MRNIKEALSPNLSGRNLSGNLGPNGKIILK
jgi:hypothetical protein